MEILKRLASLMPEWMAGAGILVLAIAVAFGLYALTSRAILSLSSSESGFWRTLFGRVKGIVCLTLVLIATSLAVQLPYFSDRAASTASRIISMAVIGLLGWSAMVAVDLASAVYLRRFSTDTADDLLARKHFTQIRVLRRAIDILIVLITVGAALMSFEPVRQFGVSLFASAGAAGLVVGLAARPVLSNLIAGIQLAITQPIRIKDAVVVEGEWGWIDEITSTYVVVKLWDWRRLIVPLSYFMEKPFQNWTRQTGEIIGSVMMYLDYQIPVEKVRTKLEEIVNASKLWNKKVVNLQVTDFRENCVEIRMLVSANSSPEAWDLRCEVREKMLAHIRQESPASLPRRRIQVEETSDGDKGTNMSHRPPKPDQRLGHAGHA